MATAQTVRSLFLAMPNVEEYSCYRTPGFRVGKKFMARLWEDMLTLVLRVPDADLRAGLLENEPELFHVTDHYRGYPAVLVRLPKIDKARLAELLEMTWRAEAPPKILASVPARTPKTKKTTMTRKPVVAKARRRRSRAK